MNEFEKRKILEKYTNKMTELEKQRKKGATFR